MLICFLRTQSSSGRPNLGHEELVSPDKLECLLKHPLSIESDKILVANFELLAWRSRIEARGDVPGSKLDSHTVDFTRRSMGDLQRWYTKWDTVLGERDPLPTQARASKAHPSLSFFFFFRSGEAGRRSV